MEHPSLDAYLGSLENEDQLLEMNRELEELVQHPGWARYTELLDVIGSKVVGLIVNDRITSDPGAYALKMADRTGYVRGLRDAGRAIAKVSAKSRALVAALEREDQREDSWAG
jgi:hypothetical protein